MEFVVRLEDTNKSIVREESFKDMGSAKEKASYLKKLFPENKVSIKITGTYGYNAEHTFELDLEEYEKILENDPFNLDNLLKK